MKTSELITEAQKGPLVVGNYVGKYLAKHLANRRKEDRRKKLVRYSKGANRYRQQFSWVSPGAAVWRAKIGALARCCGGNPSEWKLKEEFGPRWAHRLRPLLCAIRIEPAPRGRTNMPVDQWSLLFGLVQAERLRLRPPMPEELSRRKRGWLRLAATQRTFSPSAFASPPASSSKVQKESAPRAIAAATCNTS